MYHGFSRSLAFLHHFVLAKLVTSSIRVKTKERHILIQAHGDSMHVLIHFVFFACGIGMGLVRNKQKPCFLVVC